MYSYMKLYCISSDKYTQIRQGFFIFGPLLYKRRVFDSLQSICELYMKEDIYLYASSEWMDDLGTMQFYIGDTALVAWSDKCISWISPKDTSDVWCFG